MTKNLHNLYRLALILLLLPLIPLLCTSCETTYSLTCPYVIGKSHVEIGDKEDKYKFAGMHFSFYNESRKDVESFVISFMLYDSEGNNPFIGSNCIVSKCNWKLEGGEAADFIVNLDPYLSVIPDEPFIIDYLYVREITYSDGSSWKDPYGMYCIREEYE